MVKINANYKYFLQYIRLKKIHIREAQYFYKDLKMMDRMKFHN